MSIVDLAPRTVPRLTRTGAPVVVVDARVVSGTGGGPDKTILKSPAFLRPFYHNLCVYLHPPGDPGFAEVRRKAERYGAPFAAVPDRGPWDWDVVVELLRLCRRHRAAIWHGHDYKSNALGLLLNRFWPMRLVTTVHGWVKHTSRTPLYYKIDRLCLPHYESVVCVSEDLRDAALAAGVAPERCLLVENAIDTEEFRRRRSLLEAKATLGLPPGRLVVGAVGRLSAEKGFELLIRAVDSLLRCGVDLSLVIVGEGDQEAPLRTLVRELGREDRVQLLGYRSDTIEIYQALDVFALSSLREGLPNVVLEAMALEVPVVATRIAGVPRLVRDGDNGLLVEPGSADALATALGRLLGDPGERQRLGEAGRRTVTSDYSFAARMRRIHTLYDDLLGQRVSNTPPRSGRLQD